LDKKRKVYISGQLGNQLLRCFIIIADSLENNYGIEAITVTKCPDYLEQLLELRVETNSQPGDIISEIDHNSEGHIHRLFKYRTRILDEGWVKLKQPESFVRARMCVHMRGMDKKVAPLQWYYKKAKSISDKDTEIYVCTDDKWSKRLLKIWLISTGISGISFTNQDAVRDWFTLLHADTIYCSSSSFPLSTLLFDPDKEVVVCSRKSTNYDYRIEAGKIAEFPFIETAMEYCPNLRFED